MTEMGSRATVIAVSGLCAVSAAALLWLGLSKLALPSGFAGRLADLETRTAGLEASGRGAGKASPYAPGAVCDGLGAGELQEVARKLAAAAPAGVSLMNLQLNPPDAVPARRIAPAVLRLQARGDYPQLTAWLDGLAHGQPEVFVDHLDFALQDGAVTVNLSGKVYCWTSAAQ